MIGTKFYKYDGNKRVYTDPETGEKSSGAPIFKYSFREFFVVGETSRSWLLSQFQDAKLDGNSIIKIPKKGLPEEFGFLTEELKANALWANENSYRIQDEVRRCSIKMLRKIDALLKENAR